MQWIPIGASAPLWALPMLGHSRPHGTPRRHRFAPEPKPGMNTTIAAPGQHSAAPETISPRTLATALASRIIAAMLAHHPSDWTINGFARPAHAHGREPRARTIIEPPSPQGWTTTALEPADQNILVNCIIDGVLTYLPGLEALQK